MENIIRKVYDDFYSSPKVRGIESDIFYDGLDGRFTQNLDSAVGRALDIEYVSCRSTLSVVWY